MSSAKHTPGPWKTLAVGEPRECLAVADKDNLSLLTVVDEGNVKFAAIYNKSDAHLIAAAPDLLDALELLVAGIEDSVSKTYLPLVKAQAAIAKAIGGAA